MTQLQLRDAQKYRTCSFFFNIVQKRGVIEIKLMLKMQNRNGLTRVLVRLVKKMTEVTKVTDGAKVGKKQQHRGGQQP